MTREEAIENITEIKKCEAGVYAEALEIAIEALEQEPCEDTISRQATLEPYKVLNDTDTLCVALIRANIMQQPPVTPQQKVGMWIKRGQDIYCSICNNESAYNPFGASKFSKYCPNCGAKMVEPQESEV